MKEFYFDRQTIEDLELFKDPRDRSPSIFGLYNHALTPGGSTALKEIMLAPSSDHQYLKKRTAMFDYLSLHQQELELRSHQVEAIERYLELTIAFLKPNFLDRWHKVVMEWFNPTNEYYLIETGLRQIHQVLSEIHRKFNFDDQKMPELLLSETKQIRKFFPILKKALPKKLTRSRITGKLDKLCRKKYKDDLLAMTHEIHRLDAFIGIAKAISYHGFKLPSYQEKKYPSFTFQKLKHPLLPEAKSYDFSLEDDQNMCFITGPNMAGKSTFLKSVGIGIFLAHLGFPLPAESLTLTAFDGMSTTINLPDNLGLGHSHYYAEVNRVREVTQLLQQHGRLMIIFDELFRGTNVKDAHEASRDVIGAFAQLKNSSFLVSTHIVEVAEDLKNRSSILFNYFDLSWKNGTPVYAYELKEGVSRERLGMYIIEREGIMKRLQDLINQEEPDHH